MSKRRSFSPEFRAQVVLELLSGTKSSAELCRQHQVSPQLLAQWKATFLERAALLRLAGAWPTYGRPRLTAMLRREGWAVNHKQVGRLMRQLGLCAQHPQRKPRTTNSSHGFTRYPNLVSGLVPTWVGMRPDQVWVSDITYIQLQQGFAYLAVLMDVFTRSIRGWHFGRNLDGPDSSGLRRALQTHRPESHHSDQGVQYAHREYVDLLRSVGAQVSMAEVGEPAENGYAERLIRTIKEEHVQLTEYPNYTDAYRQMGRFLDEHVSAQTDSLVSGLADPDRVGTEFESQWLREQLQSRLTRDYSR